MSDDTILIQRPESAPGVQIIRMNRPEKKNALTRTMYAAMTDALRQGDADPDVRAHLFLGAPGAFSAGNDMQDFLAFAMGGSLGAEVIDFLKTLATTRKPLLAGVDGLAIGVGTTLTFHCDMTIASDRSLFRTPFTDLAIVPEAASTLLLPNIAGHQRAFAMLAAGLPFSAEEAREAGFVWRVVPPDALEAEALSLARDIAAKPPQALAIARDLIRGSEQQVLERIDAEAEHFKAQLKSAEARAAFEAFMSRKK
ncbi:crotonase/enoyl-CoA hydratase family protein [Georhizobium profundi]|uniref:Crotonase/enoyl-CoA hydratase family protein n=1 Tax=Georhizobium profundi TaxID=2341112 RepID=A0A3S9B794_9HYPH|nr:crotonase/enoyl-CoA hydratase family protein [Georhizobium profundi]AZN72822.1 crotonase/enoyl-CoA hydratase family protein [Georhizobium profundi]